MKQMKIDILFNAQTPKIEALFQEKNKTLEWGEWVNFISFL